MKIKKTKVLEQKDKDILKILAETKIRERVKEKNE